MEKVAVIITMIIIAAVSLLAGVLIGTDRMKKAVEEGSVGNLRIDRSEEDEAHRAFLEIVGTTIEDISRKNFIILKVINENYLSRD